MEYRIAENLPPLRVRKLRSILIILHVQGLLSTYAWSEHVFFTQRDVAKNKV